LLIAFMVGLSVLSPLTSLTSTSHAAKPCIIGFEYGNTASTIYQNVVKFTRAEAKARGCTLVEGSSAGDPVKQVNTIQDWVTSGKVTAIVVLPLANDVGPALKRAHAAHIVIVGYSQSVPYGDAAITYNNILTGQQLASAAVKWARMKFGTNMSKLVYGLFTYDQCGKPCTERTDTVRSQIAAQLKVKPAIEGIAVATEDGYKLTQNMMQAHPDLNMVLGINDAGALGAYQAFKQAKKNPADVFVGGMDGQKEALQLIAKEGSAGIYKASSALRISDIGNAVADLPADILRSGKAHNLLIQPVLVDNAATAKAVLKKVFGI
jgi:ribose transport system substrate-binding protein